MRRQLTREQVDRLLARLRELNIKPGLYTTALWQFGRMVPPFDFTPPFAVAAYGVLLLAFHFSVVLLASQRVAINNPLWLVTLNEFSIFLMANIYLTVRSRSHALLALTGLFGAPIAYAGWLLSQPPSTGDFIVPLSLSSMIHDPAFAIIAVALPIGLALREYRRRKKIGRITWHEIVAEMQVAEVF